MAASLTLSNYVYPGAKQFISDQYNKHHFPLFALPNEILIKILNLMPKKDLSEVSLVCKKLKNIVDSNAFCTTERLKQDFPNLTIFDENVWIRIFGKETLDQHGLKFEAVPVSARERRNNIGKLYRAPTPTEPFMISQKVHGVVEIHIPKGLSINILHELTKKPLGSVLKNLAIHRNKTWFDHGNSEDGHPVASFMYHSPTGHREEYSFLQQTAKKVEERAWIGVFMRRTLLNSHNGTPDQHASLVKQIDPRCEVPELLATLSIAHLEYLNHAKDVQYLVDSGLWDENICDTTRCQGPYSVRGFEQTGIKLDVNYIDGGRFQHVKAMLKHQTVVQENKQAENSSSSASSLKATAVLPNVVKPLTPQQLANKVSTVAFSALSVISSTYPSRAGSKSITTNASQGVSQSETKSVPQDDFDDIYS